MAQNSNISDLNNFENEIKEKCEGVIPEESVSNFVAMTNLVRNIDKKKEECEKIASKRDAAHAELETEKKQLEAEVLNLKARLKEMEA